MSNADHTPQCAHAKRVFDTTFYCVELRGHQCPHTYTVTMDNLESALERQKSHFAEQIEARARELAELASVENEAIAAGRQAVLRVAELERTMREIAARLESAAAETDCFNVCESAYLARAAMVQP